MSCHTGDGGRASPESGDHLGESDDFLNAVAHQISEMWQHGQTRGIILTGVWTATVILIHHQKTAQVQLSVNRLYRQRALETTLTAKYTEIICKASFRA